MWFGVPGISRVGRAVLAKLIETQIWHPSMPASWDGGGETQQKNNGTCLLFCCGQSYFSSPYPEAAAPVLELKASEFVSKSLGRPCKRMPKSIAALPPGIPAGVHSQMIWGLFFPALVLWVKEPSVGMGPLLLRVHLCS